MALTGIGDRIGFGGAAIGGLFAAVTDAQARATLDAAHATGIRHIDTAPYYGHGRSETRIGAWLPGHLGVDLSTKVGRRLEPCAPADTPDHGFVDPPPLRPVFDYSRDGVRRAFDDSLARLGVERVGTLLLHDIGRMTHGDSHPAVLAQALDAALPAMAELKAAGMVDAIGLGVNEWAVCDAVLAHADLDVVLLAGRYTLMEQGALAFLDRAAARGMAVLAAGLFNSGLLAGGSTYDYAPADAAVLARRDALTAVAARHHVELGAAAIQLPLAHPAVRRAIIGFRSPAEVAAAMAWADAPIPADFWRELVAERLLDAGAPLPC